MREGRKGLKERLSVLRVVMLKREGRTTSSRRLKTRESFLRLGKVEKKGGMGPKKLLLVRSR